MIKCPSTRTWIVLKTERFFSPFMAFRPQKCRFSKNGPQSGVFCCKRRLIRDLSEFTQQDGRKKRTTKRLCVTNVTGLLLACFVVIFTKHFMFSGLLQKDQLKESEVWRKVISKQNYCHACLTRFAVFLPLPSCCVSSLLRYEDGDGR